MKNAKHCQRQLAQSIPRKFAIHAPHLLHKIVSLIIVAMRRESKQPRVGLSLSSRPTSILWRGGIIAGLDAKRFDTAFNQTTICDNRKEKYDLSDPYIVIPSRADRK